MQNSHNIILSPFIFYIIYFYCHDLMIKENIIFTLMYFFLNLFYKKNECIFEIKINSLVI